MTRSPENTHTLIRLGVLQAGRVPVEMSDDHADYDQLFVDLLGEQSFDYRHWAVLDGEFPNSIEDADAWLITGSRFGAYEDHAWIPPLEALIREVFAANKPMVGICFGHQIIAQALGGKVEKFSGGWSVGRVEYQLDPAIFSLLNSDHLNTSNKSVNTALLAFHQDQVIRPPTSAKTVGQTDFCQHAALLYGDQILTIQPHPEFNSELIGDLLVARAAILPEDLVSEANESLHLPIERDSMVTTFRDFLNRDKR